MRGFPSLFAFLVLSASTVFAQDYIVRNQCPTPIEWFIGGQSQGNLSTGNSVIRHNLGPNPGFIYTSANGGFKNGQLVAVRAGFFFEPNYWYYYIVRDGSSVNFNTGISITPSQQPNNGFCVTAACREGNSTNAYRQPPVFNGGPPPSNAPAPLPPNHQCKTPGTNFDITFCPEWSWPQARGAPILANFNRQKCVDIRGNVLANGTPVQIYDCNDTGAQRWFLNFGGTRVQLAGTNFCLDAGSNPVNGAQMKIWQCYDNLPAQQWYLTQDFRIALQGTGTPPFVSQRSWSSSHNNAAGLCLDLTGGNTGNGNILQAWQCTDFNANQVWGLPDFL
ncbi:G-X-X-X-Q-X-W domain-containing protein [Coprinopsis marcescibilis]|uniref:G-X-X-X-Q-X-W domain-containing protein n=1 Tax=Coprinopsis marcescibilis TaxID=230819 RepID=A0A5C3L8Q2_COPMA|nr:G-X-X-X-Q-X-W domain-containing protein [Coprinopsis marcescibilis]